ncbi:oligosaccharide flippase family protein [Caulobacter henricii]|uniref:oligosaccharide flippase family protein n=1 Tax=Caulobacter henricii TaxID=69395 RepID=UPI0009FE6F42|nr:oligosaccharide flippase family protein [Caulobacter henricii]
MTNILATTISKILLSRRSAEVVLVYLGFSLKFLSPLVLYPVLARRLGIFDFGLFVSAYGLATVLSVIIEYGFSMSGTRAIALARDVQEKAQIASDVVFSRLLLVPLVAIVGLLISSASSHLRDNFVLVALAVGLGIMQGGSSLWYFQGVGKPVRGVAVEAFGQLTALGLIMMFVVDGHGLLLALFFQLIGFAIVCGLGGCMMFAQVGFRAPTMRSLVTSLRDTFPLFFSRASVVIFSTASVFLMSVLAKPQDAAVYGASDRVIGAFTAFLSPLASIMLSKLVGETSRDRLRGLNLSIIMISTVAFVYSMITVFLLFFSHTLMSFLFGAQFKEGGDVLNVLALTLPIIAANTVMGAQVLVSLRMDKYIAITLSGAAVVSLVSTFLIVPNYAGIGMASSRIITEIFIFLCYSFLILRARKAPG